MIIFLYGTLQKRFDQQKCLKKRTSRINIAHTQLYAQAFVEETHGSTRGGLHLKCHRHCMQLPESHQEIIKYMAFILCLLKFMHGLKGLFDWVVKHQSWCNFRFILLTWSPAFIYEEVEIVF